MIRYQYTLTYPVLVYVGKLHYFLLSVTWFTYPHLRIRLCDVILQRNAVDAILQLPKPWSTSCKFDIWFKKKYYLNLFIIKTLFINYVRALDGIYQINMIPMIDDSHCSYRKTGLLKCIDRVNKLNTVRQKKFPCYLGVIFMFWNSGTYIVW